jgi:flagellar assembly protein FliH
MSHSCLIAFDRPLAGATLPGQGRTYSEAEVAAKMQEAYRQGVDATRAAADQQMVEFRADVAQLGDGVLRQLGDIEPRLVGQLRDALPGLAVEIAQRLLAGYEPPAEVVAKLCAEVLAQLFPERDGLELSLSSRDEALLKQVNPAWLQNYPGLRLTVDPALQPGDCLVRSRFGLTDARQSVKLAALRHSLTAA